MVGDDLNTIASGPTVPDPTTFQNAFEICQKYGILNNLPSNVVERLQAGMNHMLEETPKEGSIFFETTHNMLVGSARDVAKVACESLGSDIFVEMCSCPIQGESAEFGKKLFREHIPSLKAALQCATQDSVLLNNEKFKIGAWIGTGELTVTLRGSGKGGRNQEMLASFLNEAWETTSETNPDYYVVISAAFDGIEGNSGAMGAIVDSSSITRLKKVGKGRQWLLDQLHNNNTYEVFSMLNDLIVTGHTGTNVNDMTLVLYAIPVET